MEKDFKESPSHTLLCNQICPNLSLPSQPIATLWSTWIEAAIFYSQHFYAVKRVVDMLDAENGAAIKRVQQVRPRIRSKQDLLLSVS